MMYTPPLYLSLIVFVFAHPACSKETTTQTVTSQSTTQTKLKDHEKYLSWHNICLQGDVEKIEQQIAKFESELASSPNNDLARAYLGSAYALKAKHVFFPTTKLKSLKKGKSLMEAAVKGSPNNTRVRMVRAIAYYKVPKRFDTRPTSISDFETLLEKVQKKSCKLSTNEKQAILYYAYLAFSEGQHESANKAKTLCHKLNPQSEYGKRAK